MTVIPKTLLLIFDNDGPIANFHGYKHAVLEYYEAATGVKGFSEEDHASFFYGPYKDGVRAFCEKHNKPFFYDNEEYLHSEEHKQLSQKVRDARLSAGTIPGIDEQIERFYHDQSVLVGINSSAPVERIHASINSTLNYFDLIGSGGIPGQFFDETEYLNTPTAKCDSKVVKFEWLKKMAGLPYHQAGFITDTPGDVVDALRVGIPEQNIFLVTFGVFSKELANSWRISSGHEDVRLVNQVAEFSSLLGDVMMPAIRK